jgi:hypothetical protein
MKQFLSAVSLAVLAVSAQAYSGPALLGSSEFRLPSLSQVRVLAAESVAGVPGEALDKVTDLRLLARCGKDSLFGFVDTEAQYRAAVERWTGVLNAAGIKPGTPTFKDGMYVLPYDAGGRRIREFMAEPRQFKPKDEASLRENMGMILAEMRKEGFPIVASYVVDVEILLPTYSIYYLTGKDENEDHEKQVRILNRGDDIDFDILEGAGIRFLQKPETWMGVYVGPELGFVSRIAKTLESIQEKLKDRVEWLVGQGKVMIGTRIGEIPADVSEEYRYYVNIYFYQ